MAAKLGPKIVNDGLVLCLDAADANSYAGEPVTNMAYNIGISGQGSTWEAITSVPVSEGQTGPGANINFKKLNDNSLANTFLNSGGKIFRNYVNNPATSDNTSFNNNGGFKYASSINLTSGGASGYVIISFWCYLVTGYQGYGGNGLPNSYMQFQNSGGTYTGNGSKSFYVDGVSKTTNETFNGDTGRWKFVQIRFTKPANSTAIRNFYIYSDRNTQGEMYVCQLQIEDRSDSGFYQVPFVEGVSSRSATDGWVDLSGNSNSGTLTNMVGTGVSHYRDGQVIMPIDNAYLDFDGSNDYVSTSFGSGRDPYSNPISFVAWVKSDITTNKMWLDHGSNGTNQRLYSALITADNTDAFGIQGSAWSLPSNADTSKWYHQAIVMDSGTARAYYDGIAAGTKSYTSYTLPGNTIVGGRSSYYWDGKIACFSIYNKALTAAEVLSNYNATKGRFSL